MSDDDWRLRVDLHEEGLSSALTARMESRELTHDLETSFHDRVVVSIDGPEMFCYTGTREQAERAAELIRKVADEHEWDVDFELKRWHPIAEEWRDPDEAAADRCRGAGRGARRTGSRRARRVG